MNEWPEKPSKEYTSIMTVGDNRLITNQVPNTRVVFYQKQVSFLYVRVYCYQKRVLRMVYVGKLKGHELNPNTLKVHSLKNILIRLSKARIVFKHYLIDNPNYTEAFKEKWEEEIESAWRLESALGREAMGQIYKAFDITYVNIKTRLLDGVGEKL
jgi:hypothetical protein